MGNLIFSLLCVAAIFALSLSYAIVERNRILFVSAGVGYLLISGYLAIKLSQSFLLNALELAIAAGFVWFIYDNVKSGSKKTAFAVLAPLATLALLAVDPYRLLILCGLIFLCEF